MSKPHGRRREAIVFVHGFNSKPRCWNRLLRLLKNDQRIEQRFYLDSSFSYPTSLVELNPSERIPSVSEIGQWLGDHLDSDHLADRKLTLVGHSLGGLVIHSYLAHMLDQRRGSELRAIRQVVTIATPHGGSRFGGDFRRVFFAFFDNPQEEQLKPLNDKTSDVVQKVMRRIATTSLRDDGHWPIPVQCMGGMQDGIVEERSAKWYFDNYKTLPGDHDGVLRPPGKDSNHYRELVEVLLDPVGHPNVFEVEHYETSIKVRPRRPGEKIEDLQLNGGPLEIDADNICELKRTVRFAKHNRCQSLFQIRYQAGTGSYLRGYISPEHNEAGHMNKAYKEAGQSYTFQFTPKQENPPRDYRLQLEIYNGFGEGRRDLHFHFGSKKSQGGWAHYRRLTYTLDLSEYKVAGYDVEDPPSFLLHEGDPDFEDCGQVCKKRRKLGEGRLLAPDARAQEGVWTWELYERDQGVADFFWRISDKPEG